LRPSSVDKATVAKNILKEMGEDVDFLVCIGDGKNDEQLFTNVKTEDCAITATVGKKRTEAGFYVETVEDVESLLMEIILKGE
jgi:trehalose-6-phosphatase